MEGLADLLGPNVPRYTSYPTVPHCTPAVDAETYSGWLEALDPSAELSLYLHVPFCDALCLYCGCNTAVTRREAPREHHARLLEVEIAAVADRLAGRRRVGRIHWGGGTPTSLDPPCFLGTRDLIRRRFDLAWDAEVAIEIDPGILRPIGSRRFAASE